jgi:hypothetical protein
VDLDAVLREHGGVISRRLVIEAGGDDNLIERMIRRNEWRSLHAGVYVDHTGQPTDEQRRIGAVLYGWPAALAGESALLANGVRNITEDLIRISVARGRKVVAPPGVCVTRLKGFDERVQWNRSPPRLRIEEAALEVASRRRLRSGEGDAVALLADLCQQRLSTPDRLLEELAKHPRLPGRPFIHSVLDDVATGAFSLLEQRYLTRVERAHGLPRGIRQERFSNPWRTGFRDVRYPGQAVLVELDGRSGHEFAADRWADLERDLVAVTGVSSPSASPGGWWPVRVDWLSWWRDSCRHEAGRVTFGRAAAAEVRVVDRRHVEPRTFHCRPLLSRRSPGRRRAESAR